MSKPTRFTKGISTNIVGTLLGDYPLPASISTGSNGMDVYTYTNDYDDLGSAASRTITGTSSTLAPADGVGGKAILTPGGASTVSTVARTNAGFQFVAGQRFWYNARLQTSGVGAGVITRFGVQHGNGANTTNDALYFTKVTGAAGGVNLVSTVATVATTLVTGVVASTAAATDIDVGFYYDGTDLLVFANDLLVARIASPTIGASGQTLTNTLLQPFFQITPVATETLTIDYELIACEVSR